MKFSIVVLSYNQPESTLECLKSILALKPREFPEKNIFVVHNGSDPEVVASLQSRFNRFHHVILKENVGFTGGANMGLSVAFQLQPWTLFLTQDCSLVHFPQATPFEPCIAAPKIYKRTKEHMNSIGGAVDLDMGTSYYCRKPKEFWRAFEDNTLHPFVPRTAFWMHQQVFEKVKGFDESLYSQWEDVDFGIRARKAGEMLQIDEGTEVIHHRKGFARLDPFYRSYLLHRNRLIVSRRYIETKGARIKFEFGAIADTISFFLGRLLKGRLADAKGAVSGYFDSFSSKAIKSKEQAPIIGEETKTKTKTRTKTKAADEEGPKSISAKKDKEESESEE